MFLYDYFTRTGKIVGPKDTLKLDFTQQPWSYFILAPVGRCGIAFVGDPDKFVTGGKKRIEKLVDTESELRVTVLLAKGEQSIRLCGYAPWAPDLMIDKAIVYKSEFDSASHLFRIEIKPGTGLTYQRENGDLVGRVNVRLIAHH